MAQRFSLCPRDSAAVRGERPTMPWSCNGCGHELTETVGSLCQTLAPGIWGILLRSAMFPQHGASKRLNPKLHAILKRSDTTYYQKSKHYAAYHVCYGNTYYLFVLYPYSTNSVTTYSLIIKSFSVKIFPTFYEITKSEVKKAIPVTGSRGQ
jgi:hypothetical protein